MRSLPSHRVAKAEDSLPPGLRDLVRRSRLGTRSALPCQVAANELARMIRARRAGQRDRDALKTSTSMGIKKSELPIFAHYVAKTLACPYELRSYLEGAGVLGEPSSILVAPTLGPVPRRPAESSF